MQVLSVIRLDIVTQVGKRQFPVKTFYDFYDMALTHIISAENNYSFNFSLQHPEATAAVDHCHLRVDWS